MTDKKLSFLVRKISKEIGISEHTDKNVDVIFRNLTFQNKEYQRRNAGQLRSLVSSELTDMIAAAADSSHRTQENTTPGPASLNQVVSSRYNSAGPNASKRSRPEGTGPNSDDGKGIDPADGAGNVSDGEAVGKPLKRIRSKKDSSDSSGDGKTKAAPRIPFCTDRPAARMQDMAGIDSIVSVVKELVFYPVKVPEIYRSLGVRPPSGILLNGPSGCGKTSLALSIAGELGLPFFKATGPELVGGTSGESEERIRDLFKAAIENAPSVLFIDSIDVIAPKKDSSQRGMDRRIVAQLYDCFDQIRDLPRVENKPPASTAEAVKLEEPEGELKPETSTETGTPTLSQNGGDTAFSRGTNSVQPFVIVMAATSRVDTLDPGLRGRFAQELTLPVPDAAARTQILQIVSKDLSVAADVDFKIIGKLTPGFVGADLISLVSEAGTRAVKRIISGAEPASFFDKGEATMDIVVEAATDLIKKSAVVDAQITDSASGTVASETDSVLFFDVAAIDKMCLTTKKDDTFEDTGPTLVGVQRSTLHVTLDDFQEAVKSIQPTAKREGFAVVPNVTWTDVGALSEVREELFQNVLEPIAHPELFRSLGLEVPAGVLFFGPPGCGKTLLAKALANQSGANFISVKGPELLNMYVGESESRVRQVFTRARASAPCVIFFDELDALCPRRGSGADGGNGVSERVVNQLLTELDGLEVRRDVYIIAATNRLELIDDAMLRPGRLGKLLYVPLPSADDRISILQAVSRNVSLDHNDIDFNALAHDSRAEGFSGADLAALVREAGLAVLQEWRQNRRAVAPPADLSNTTVSNGQVSLTPFDTTDPSTLNIPSICMRHFETAFERIHPSVSAEDRKRHDRVNHLIKHEGMGAVEAIRVARETK